MGLDSRFEERSMAAMRHDDLDDLDSRQGAQKARVQYLFVSLIMVTVNLVSAVFVYWLTNSITMKLDLLSCCSDVVGLIVNITVEELKGKTTDYSRRFQLDLIGCVVSMLALVAVAVCGLVSAVQRSRVTEQNWVPQKDRPDHVLALFIYSLFSCFLALATGGTFWKLFSEMYPHGYNMEDRLNTVSSVAHTGVDIVANGVVLCTSLSMVIQDYTNKDWDKFHKMAYRDVLGSYVIVFVTAMLVLFLSHEAWKSSRTVDDVAQPMLASSTGQDGYASTETHASPIGISVTAHP